MPNTPDNKDLFLKNPEEISTHNSITDGKEISEGDKISSFYNSNKVLQVFEDLWTEGDFRGNLEGLKRFRERKEEKRKFKEEKQKIFNGEISIELLKKYLSEDTLPNRYTIDLNEIDLTSSTGFKEAVNGLKEEIDEENRKTHNVGRHKLIHLDLECSNLSNMDLSGIRLENSNLRYANLGGTDLRNAVLNHSDLLGINLIGAKIDSTTKIDYRELIDTNIGANYVDPNLIMSKDEPREFDYVQNPFDIYRDLSTLIPDDNIIFDNIINNLSNNIIRKKQKLSITEYLDKICMPKDVWKIINMSLEETSKIVEKDGKRYLIVKLGNINMGKVTGLKEFINKLRQKIEEKNKTLKDTDKLTLSVDLSNLEVGFADLRGVDFSDCDLSEAIIYGSDLSYAKFNKTIFHNTVFDLWTLIRGCWPTHVSFAGRIDHHQIDVSNCNFNNTTFKDMNITNTALTRANMINATFNNVNFNNVFFIGANLREMDFRNNCIFGKTSFDQAKLISSNFAKVDLTGVKFSWADLKYSNLSYANLEKANLFRANLSFADMTGTKLKDAIIYNTMIDHTKGINREQLSEADIINNYANYNSNQLLPCDNQDLISDLMDERREKEGFKYWLHRFKYDLKWFFNGDI